MIINHVALVITLGKKCRCYCPRMGPNNQDTEDTDVVSDSGAGRSIRAWTHLPEAQRSQETWALTTVRELNSVLWERK